MIGINVQGMRRWLWFDSANVKEEGGRFKGINGTGFGQCKEVTVVSIDVPLTAVQGRIESEGVLV